eukprot:COSAG01_NODE_3990_length_5458_cov_2.452323_7_plen_93_part_00
MPSSWPSCAGLTPPLVHAVHYDILYYIILCDYIGDWALQRSGAITLEGTEGFTVRDALFERIDGNGVMLNGAIVGYTSQQRCECRREALRWY